jgi:hypothetical protein
MFTALELRTTAARKLKAAKTLIADNPDAVEIQLKARIIEHQGLNGWPEHRKEFRALKLRHLQTHELHDLLLLSGMEVHVKSQLLAEWSICVTWNPESRYAPSGTVTPQAAEAMLQAVEELLRHL